MLGSGTLHKLVHRVPASFIDALVSGGFVERDKLNGWAGKTNVEIERHLLGERLCGPEEIAKAYGSYFDVAVVKLIGRQISADVLEMIPYDVAASYKIIAFDFLDNVLRLAVGEPNRLQARAPAVLQELGRRRGLTIKLAITTPEDIRWALNLYNKSAAQTKQSEPTKVNLPVVPPKENNALAKIPQKTESLPPGLPKVDLLNRKIASEVLAKVPREVAEKYKMVVFEVEPPLDISPIPKKIKVALLNPDNPQVREILNFIKKRNGIEIEEYQADKEGLRRVLAGYELPSRPMPVERPISKPKKTEESVLPGEVLSSKEREVALKEEVSQESPLGRLLENKVASTQPPPQSQTLTSKESTPVAEVSSRLANQSLATAEDQKKFFASRLGLEKPTVVKETTGVKPISPVPTVVSPGHPPAKVEAVHPETAETTRRTLAKIAGSEGVTEIRQEEIQVKEGLAPEVIKENEGLEESNLDKFLTKPISSLQDLASVIKAGLVPEIVAAMISLAVGMKASDIHLEATEVNVRLRYRVDGILRDVVYLPLSLHAPLVSRIKILSKLKIDEQRIPQDGRFNVVVGSHEIDLRISTLPTVHGEKVVARILDKSAGILTLEELGLTGSGFDILVKNVSKPYGIILATGPTGSGKSTTLYAILQRISTPGVNVITLEDPVEYEIPGINQAQVKPQIGFTFAEGLRSVLRQDPNVIMVGEIRDLETAAMATHAALTGHLVLSTLHTNDAAGALPRLINMGVEPFLITSSINAIIAQRLVRKTCPHCREPITLPDSLMRDIQAEIAKIQDARIANSDTGNLVFYRGKGCAACSNGYQGRIGIFEVLPMSHQIEALAVSKAPASAIAEEAIKVGMITMKQDGILKALKGITTIDEILRVTAAGTSR